MFTSKKLKAFGAIAATLALAGVAQPAAAQSLNTQINNEIRRLTYENPGSALVYAGCSAAAASEYNDTGSTDGALRVLVGCAAIGCGFTNDYRNCINVNTQLFLLELARP